MTTTPTKAELERLKTALADATKAENSNARRMREAIVEARARLAKGRALWNGPCHECDAVLEQALRVDNDQDSLRLAAETVERKDEAVPVAWVDVNWDGDCEGWEFGPDRPQRHADRFRPVYYAKPDIEHLVSEVYRHKKHADEWCSAAGKAMLERDAARADLSTPSTPSPSGEAIAWLMPEHVAAYQAAPMNGGLAWASPLKTEVYTVPVFLHAALASQQPAPEGEKCHKCNGTGLIAIRSSNGSYAFAGPVSDDAKGYAEAPCYECNVYPGGFDGPTGAD